MFRAPRFAHRSRVLKAAALALLAPAVMMVPAQQSTAVAASGAPDITLPEVKVHLQKFSDIAAANGGNRAWGKPGYKASVDYVASELRAAGYNVTVQSFTSGLFVTSWNVIADKPGTVGPAGPVLLLGGHLDSVPAGAGINDNGSGSAALLAVAKKYAASGMTPTKNLRFAFWGGEEVGLFGSSAYNKSLSTTERSRISAYFNFDMIASPNPGYFVYDDNQAGNALRDYLTKWYDDRGIAWEYIDVQGRSDHASFRSAGLPTSGIFSGAEEIKTAAQAAKWGGTAGKAFDPCYHLACDNLANIDDTSLDRSSDLIASVVWDFAGAGAGTPTTTTQVLQNPGFEAGRVAWTGNTEVITNTGTTPKSGTWAARFGGQGKVNTKSLTQRVAIPAGATSATLKFHSLIQTSEIFNWIAWDSLTVTASAGGTTTTLLRLTNSDARQGYVARTADLAAFKGQNVDLTFTVKENGGFPTSFTLDDAAVEVVS